MGDKINFLSQGLDNGPSPQDISQARDTYLQWLIDGMEAYCSISLKLDQIYISLRAQLEEKPNDADHRLQQRDYVERATQLAESCLSAEEQEDQFNILLYDFEQQRRPPPIPLAKATVQYDRLVLLGNPGCGKTTFLRYLALQHAQAMQKYESYVHLARDGSTKGCQQPAYFPILIRVADYAEKHKEKSFNDFLRQYLHDKNLEGEGIDDLFISELAQGGCLVLLDGLDEIVSADDRRKIVMQIKDLIRAHAKGGTREINRFIITSRIAGYRSAPLSSVSGEPFAHYVVEEMSDHQIERFLARWCNIDSFVYHGKTPRAKNIRVHYQLPSLPTDGQSVMETIHNETYGS